MLALLLASASAYVLPQARPSHHVLDRQLLRTPLPRRAAPVRLTALTAEEVAAAPAAEAEVEEPVRVFPAGCSSCESAWLANSKQTEEEETERLALLKTTNMTDFMADIWDYAQRMNDTQRQEVALIPDTMLRNFVIHSSTPPSPLMETVYNNTMQRVPYEQARVPPHRKRPRTAHATPGPPRIIRPPSPALSEAGVLHLRAGTGDAAAHARRARAAAPLPRHRLLHRVRLERGAGGDPCRGGPDVPRGGGGLHQARARCDATAPRPSGGVRALPPHRSSCRAARTPTPLSLV